MLEDVGQFGLHYKGQAQGTLGILVATPSVLSKVIESQGWDMEILSIKDRVRSNTSDEGWVINTDGSLRYRGRVVVPQSADLREEILKEFHCLVLLCIQVARRCVMIFVASITRVG